MSAGLLVNRPPGRTLLSAWIVLICACIAAARTPPNDDTYIPRIDITKSQSYSPKREVLPPLIPLHYEVFLQPDLERGTFTGQVNISLTATKPEVTYINLHQLNLNITSKYVYDSVGKGRNPIDSSSYNPSAERQMYRVKFALPIGDPSYFIATFSGKLNDTDTGFYRSYYINSKEEKRWYAETQFQATHARRAFPCYDLPQFRTPFVISIAHPQDRQALSNTPARHRTQPDKNGIVVTTFDVTPPMPTYLVAFAVNDFQQVTNDPGNITTWARADAIKHVKEAHTLTSSIINFFEQYTNQPYFLSKLDQIASRGHHGAMENWGLIIYRERKLVDHPNATTKDMIDARESLAHELAHQWFGNLVTLQTWNTVWLSEGFATFMMYLAIDAVKKELDRLNHFPIQEIPKAFRDDEAADAAPITHMVSTPEEISANFNTLSYSKGGSLLRMLQHAIGKDTFQKAIQRYLASKRLGNAEPSDLGEAFSKQAQLDQAVPSGIILNRVLVSWTEQGGFPIVNVTRDRATQKVTFQQERFLGTPGKPPSESWWVPVSFATKSSYKESSTKPSVWIPQRESAVLAGVSEPAWVLANKGRTGYFRVNYDAQNWEELIKQLHTSHNVLDGVDIAMLIDDAAAAARTGRLGHDVLFKILAYLPNETRYEPWEAAADYIQGYLSPRFNARGDKDSVVYQAWLQKLLAKPYLSVGPKQTPGESTSKRLLRQTLLPLAREAYLPEFMEHVRDGIPLDSDNEEVLACLKIRQGPEGNVVNMFADILMIDDEDDLARSKLIRALACTTKSSSISVLLEQSIIESGLQVSEKNLLWRSVLAAPSATEPALDLLKCRARDIFAKYGKGGLATRILSLSKYCDTEFQYTALENFIKFHAYKYGIFPETRRAREIVRQNLDWNKNYRGQVLALMKSPTQPTPSPDVTTSKPLPPTPAPSDGTFRLPTNIVPSHYDIRLVPYLNNFTFKGEVKITAKVAQQTDEIVIHASRLAVALTEVIDIKTNKKLEVKSVTAVQEKEILQIKVQPALSQGQDIDIVIKYSGNMSSDNAGLYKSSYEEKYVTKWLAATQFQATAARRAFPCFDEPAWKATFSVFIAHEPKHNVISNMPRLSTSPPDPSIGGYLWDSFAKSPRMASYLVAFVISEFRPLQISNNPVNITLWGRPEALFNGSLVAQNVTAALIGSMTSRFDFKQPVPKFDLVALPDFGPGAMENWGLITFREYLLLDSVAAGTSVRERIASVIAHELAHQWFGNVVTAYWWSTMWTQEGMATYQSFQLLDEIQRSTFYRQRLAIEESASALESDSTELSLPLNADATSINRVTALADDITYSKRDLVARADDIRYLKKDAAARAADITYSKGAVVLNLLRSVLGQKEFDTGLAQYLKKHAYQNVAPPDLANALASQKNDLGDGVNVIGLMSSWTNQSGYPVINVRFNSDTNTYIVSQEGKRFLHHAPLQGKPKDQSWIIPIFLSGSPGSEYRGNLVPAEKEKIIKLPSTSQVYLINYERQVPARVNYDTRTWLRLVMDLTVSEIRRNTFSPISRATLFDDAMWFVRTKRLDPTLALNLLPGYRIEESASVWLGFQRSFRYLQTMLRGSPIQEKFSDFLREVIVEDHYKKLGWSHKANDPNEVRLKRSIIASMACSLRISDCRREAIGDYSGWTANKGVQRDTLSLAICEGLSRQRVAFAGAFATLLSTRKEDQEMRSIIVSGLGCTNVPDTRKLLLTFLTGLKGFWASDVLPGVDSLIRNGYLDEVVQYVADNYPSIKSKLGKGLTESLLSSVLEQVVKAEHLDKLKKAAGSDISDSVKVSLYVAEDNVKSRDTVIQAVRTWLASYVRPPKPTPPPPIPPPTRRPTTTTTKRTTAATTIKPTGPQITTPTPTPAPTPTPPPSNVTYRLPRDVIPISYRLKLNPLIEKSLVEGEAIIKIKVEKKTNFIVFHSEGLQRKEVVVVDGTGRPIRIKTIRTDAKNHFVQLEMSEPLTVSSTYDISILYSVRVSGAEFGFFTVAYSDDNLTKQLLATNFAPIYARRAFPCFDEPDLRATFDFEIKRNIKQTVLTNTLLISSRRDSETGRITDVFETTPAMSTYQVSIVVSELGRYNTYGNPAISVWARGDIGEHIYESLSFATKAFNQLQANLVYEMPIKRFNLVAIPNILSSSAGWGLVILPESHLVPRDNMTTTSLQSLSRSVYEGLATQWFGNAVAVEWWNDSWLKDGIKTFLSKLFADTSAIGGTQGADLSELVLASDGIETSVPLSEVVNSPNEIALIANRESTRAKGGALTKVLYESIGKTAFLRGLQTYIAKKKLGAATAQDFSEAFEKTLTFPLPQNVKFKDLIDSWSQAGYPVLNVKRDASGATATVSQEQFFSHPKLGSGPAKKWIIPLNFKQLGNYQPTLEFLLPSDQGKTVNLGSPKDVVIFNWNRAAPYRVNYDSVLWNELNATLSIKKSREAITVADRAGLIDDAFWLARVNRLNYSVPLELTKTLSIEIEPAVLKTVRKTLRHLDAMFFDTASAKVYKRYLLAILEPIWKQVGWSSNLEPTIKKLDREILTEWLRDLGHINIKYDAHKEFYKWNVGQVSINKDVLAAAVCEGLSVMPVLDMVNSLARLAGSDDQDERASIVYGLGCTKDGGAIIVLLHHATSLYGFRHNEVPILIDSVATHGRLNTALTHVISEYPIIAKRLGENVAESIVLNLADKIRTPFQFKMLQSFVGNSTGTLAISLRIAEENLRWQNTSYHIVTDWLYRTLGEKNPNPPTARPPTARPHTASPPTASPPTASPLPPIVDTGSHRLPESILPVHYNLELIPDVKKSELTGTAQITVSAKEATKNIVMHAEALAIEKISVTKVSDSLAIAVEAFQKTERGFLNITLAEPVVIGGQYKVAIAYRATIGNVSAGLYAIAYNENNERKYALATNVYPIYARRIFPCFDEPHLRATYSVKVKRSTEQQVLCNTERLSSVPSSDGYYWDTFKTSKALATFHFALVVHEGLKETKISENTSLWTRPSVAFKTRFASNIIPQIWKNVTSHFVIGLPHEKINFVAIPSNIGSPTGTWSLIISSESRLLASTDVMEPAVSRRLVVETLTRSLLEQYVGNLVTPSRWSEVLLKEGLPSLLQHTMTGLYSENGTFEGTDLQDALETGGLESASPFHKFVDSPEDILQHVTSTKSSPLFSILRATLGEKVFDEGIRSYLKAKFLGSATVDEFAAILQSTSDKNRINLPRNVKIVDLINSWKDTAGYPLLKVSSSAADRIKISQERYISHSPVYKTVVRKQSWIVPIISQTLNQTPVLLDFLLPEDTSREVPYQSASLLNAQRSCLMRVNYDRKIWKEITARLSSPSFGSISPQDRIALRDDALTLARSEQLGYPDALGLFPSLVKEDVNPAVWVAAKSSLSHLEGLLRGTTEFTAYRKFMNDLLHRVVEKLQWVTVPPEKDNIRLTRSILISWACQLGEEKSIWHAQKIYASWKGHPQRIQKDVLEAAICAGLKSDNGTELKFVFDFFSNTHDEFERNVIANTIGCSHSTSVISNILGQAATLKGFSRSEASKLYESVATHGMVTLALTSLHQNYKVLRQNLGVNLAEKLVLNIANKVRNESEFDILENLVKNIEDPKTLILEEALTLAIDNIRWVNIGYPEQIAEWFRKSPPLGPTTTAKPLTTTKRPTQSPITKKPPTQLPITTKPPTRSPATPQRSTIPPPTTSTTSQPPPSLSYRLSNDLIPEAYTLRLTPDVVNFTMQGAIDIKFRVNRPTNLITFNAVDLTINPADIKIKKHNEQDVEKIISTFADPERQLYHIKVADDLIWSSEYTLSLNYQGKIRRDFLGFHYMDASDENGKGYILSTQFSPVFARSAFPCWDEPRFRANFTLLLARQNENTFSNGRLEQTSNPEASIGGRVWDKFETTKPLPPYLVGFQMWSKPPNRLSLQEENPKISILTRLNRTEDFKTALNTASELIKYMRNFTGQDPDLVKLDITGLPGHHFSAMENWGLYTFREAILRIPELSGAETLQKQSQVLAHEIAHQWFGNLVTLEWWDNAWMKEGLATLFETQALHNTVGKNWDLVRQFVVNTIQPTLSLDSSNSSHPLRGQINRPQEALAHLDGITYSKGASVLSMLREAVTPAVFQDGLKRYLQKRKYLSVTPTDLWDSIGEAIHNTNETILPSGISLSEIMNDWINLPGYPIINVNRDLLNSRIIITQEPFNPGNNRAIASWIVPFKLKKHPEALNKIESHWLLRNKPLVMEKVPDSYLWIIVDFEKKGFFRVNYNMLNWVMITSFLQKKTLDQITPATRAGLLDDALALARSRRLSYTIALQLTSYLHRDTSYEPLLAGSRGFAFLEAMLSGTDVEKRFKQFLHNTFGHVYNEVDWTAKPNEKHVAKLVRALITTRACKLKYAYCTKAAQKEYASWLNNNQGTADELLEATICTALETSNQIADLNRVIEVLIREKSDVRRRAYLRGAACFSLDVGITALLELATKPGRLDPKDGATVYDAVSAQNKQRANKALDFLQSNLNQVLSFVGRSTVERVLLTLADRARDPQQLTIVTDIVKTLEKTQASPVGRDAVGVLESNILWARDLYVEVEKAIRTLDVLTPPAPENQSAWIGTSTRLGSFLGQLASRFTTFPSKILGSVVNFYN